ncbi:MAG: PEP-CTERM sorting domain-containing protein [Gammaproteobacteria bacterium]|nr:PEP-CTERM sorting domain-containing protein [Gammaproteobacteria bacterium]MBU0772367.1 PEP-CTERM sorting domain-containing protein [Gammaproteobacteria bacterium]MBU0854772.1 PEP-CTERM sorting domain-containing protein [Gammaproteobacteria bacterium]MBU1845378.1 PEP-CTERM sorting domain-containing protein [Gammaproteobacteria bacterium]
MFRITVLAAALLAAGAARADNVALWDFNDRNAVVDAGRGVLSLIGGATHPGFNAGSPADAGAGNVAFQTTGYPAQGTADRSAGVRFDVSTVGYQDLIVSFDLRNSNTSSRSVAFQYTLDGSSFHELGTVAATAGDQWNSRSFDLSGVAGAGNNANFGFRVVTAFEDGGYAAARSTSNYGTTGTLRFDLVAVNGVAVSAVPEASSYGMLLAGLGMSGLIVRRRMG